MKNLIIIFVALICAGALNGQGKVSKFKTSEFLVYGVCGDCKERIEGAVDIVGVKSANWDKESGMITIIYHSKKISEDNLHDLIAAVGHRTEKVEANKKAYESLPDCCKYDDGIEKH